MVKTPVITDPSSTFNTLLGSFGTWGGVPKSQALHSDSRDFPILRNNNNNYHTAPGGGWHIPIIKGIYIFHI